MHLHDTVPFLGEQIASGRSPGFTGLPRMARAALLYAFWFHFLVFSAHWRDPYGNCSCGSRVCTSRAKHPLTPHGCLDATLDTDVLRSWWRRWPLANVAIATGPRSGIFVLDIDPRHYGDESLAALEAQFGKLPETPTVITGSGGEHFYFRLSPGVEIKNSTGLLGPGLDVRGTGGFVIAPPSVHASGNTYRWELSSRIDELPLAEPPDWLLECVLHPRAREANDKTQLVSHRVDFTRLAQGVEDGERDCKLFRLACSLRHRGYSREFAERAVIDAARRCKPPFPEREAVRKVKSAWRYHS